MSHHLRPLFGRNMSARLWRAALLVGVAMPLGSAASAQSVGELPQTAAPAQSDDGREVITVTGTRQTIQNAIEIKRSATEIVDGLSAADIGDLPALSIGEALESITGAASHRENGGATEISIRGLGPFLSSTVFNGREATNGSGDRSVNFSQFPSELMSEVAIYKTQDASLIEGGVAGQIHLNTLRPLDFGKERFQVDFKGNHNPDQLGIDNNMAGDLGYRGTLSFVDQFTFGGGARFGVSLGLQTSDISQPEQEFTSSSPTGTSLRACLAEPDDFTSNRGRGFSNRSTASDDCEDIAGGNDFVNFSGDNDTGYDTRIGSADLGRAFVIVPNERGYRQNDTQDSRDAFFTALQFQPTDRLEFNFDMQLSERVQEEDRHDIHFVNSRRNLVGTTFNSLTLSPLGSTSTFTTDTQIEARGETFNRTEKYIGGGLAVAFEATDKLRLSGDVSFSETVRTEEQWTIRTQSDPRFLVAWERNSSDAGSYTITGADVRNHDLFIDQYRARVENDLDRTNTSTAARFDAEYDTNFGMIDSVEAGMRLSRLEYYSLDGATNELSVNNSSSAGLAFIQSANLACREEFQEGNNFLSSLRTRDLFTTIDSSGQVVSSYNSWATFDTRCLVDRVFANFGASTALPELTPNTNTEDVTEDTFAVYAKANYQTAVRDIPVRGSVGLRVVNTEVESIGLRNGLTIDDSDPQNLRVIIGAELTETNVGSHDYTELLPSFSFVADLTDDKIIRGGVFRGLSRADPADMGFSRSFNFDTDPGITDPTQLIQAVVASGNPAFDPLTSWNYDLSFEWYPNEDSIFAAGVYAKQFVGGFQSVVTNETFNVDGVDITAPVTVRQTNEDTSTLTGLEFTASHNFSYLPNYFSGFGVKLGLNLADSDFEFEDSNLGVRGFVDQNGEFIQTNAGIVAPGNVPGFSKTTFSGQVYYQIGELDASVIYKYRSQYFQPFTSDGTRLRYTNDAGVWEARVSYNVNDHLRLSAEAINIFDEPRTDSFYTTDNIGQGSVYGPRIFFGARARY